MVDGCWRRIASGFWALGASAVEPEPCERWDDIGTNLALPSEIDAIRNSISIGGDSDTIGAICGAVAGAFYGVPDEIRAKAITFLPQHLLDVLDRVETAYGF